MTPSSRVRRERGARPADEQDAGQPRDEAARRGPVPDAQDVDDVARTRAPGQDGERGRERGPAARRHRGSADACAGAEREDGKGEHCDPLHDAQNR